jgi:ribonucleoside-diphosphate reductase alpha chain
MREKYASSDTIRVVPGASENGLVRMDTTVDTARIALCTLSAMNLGNIRSLDDIEGWMYNAVKGLDTLLEYQSYPVPAAHQATLDYRPLGIGVINLAYYLAKNGVKYGDPEALQLIHDTFEAIQYYGLKASVRLAKERGPCRLWKKTKYGQGLLPIDHYRRDVDKLVAPNYKLDWEGLRQDILKYGIRNATITALMPAESSAKISNSTNGVEPVRSLVTVKGNKSNISKQVVPEITKLKNKYDMLWDMTSMAGIIKTMAVIQKFVDQSISTNLSYNPAHWPEGKISVAAMLKDLLLCNKFGIKTLYYHNTNDQREENMVEETIVTPVSGMDEEPEVVDEVCDSCTI